jgi:anti-anti-sigma factor
MVDPVVVPLPESGLADLLERLLPRLDAAMVQAPRVLVLDMSAVDRISSTTIAALLWTRRRCSARGIQMLLRSPSRRCIEDLERVGLLGVLAVERGAGAGGSAGPAGSSRW